jgi:ABC-2 type transport system permease protein
VFDSLVKVLPKSWRGLAAKELRVFARDPAQWSQVFLLGGLCAVYLVSMSALPIDAFHGKVAMMVRDSIAVINLGMGGFLMSAIATRFQFTAIGREGHAWWVIRSSPVVPVTVLYAKAAVGLVPMTAVGQIVVMGSAWMLGLSVPMILLEGALAFIFALSLSGLAVSMGAWWPEFRAENAARAAQTPGAVFFMVLAQVLIFVSMLLYAVGGFGLLYTSSNAHWLGWLPIGLGVLLNLACAIGLPRRAAEDLWARGI